MELKTKLVWLLIAVLAAASGAYGLVFAFQGAAVRAWLTPADAALVGRLFWATTIVSVALVAGLGVAIVGIVYVLVLHPIHQIAVMAGAIRSGDFGKQLAWNRRDEIGRLAHELDTMSDQLRAAQQAAEAHLEALEQLRHADRVATLGKLASSVAHELGNPLNVIEMRAQLIEGGEAETVADVRQNASIIVAQTRRMTRIISEILSFARRQPARPSRLDLVRVVRNGIALSDHIARKHKLSIQLDAPEQPLELDGDEDKLLQVVVNLVVNAVQATEAGGIVHVGVREKSQASKDDPTGLEQRYACIDVLDHGVGISAQSLPQIFQPFFSSKRVGEGTGLGLSVAQGIAKEHDGWITVNSELGRGSSFKVYLPCDVRKDGELHAAQATLRG
jgi:two-component system NtrC family sensor kinase